LDGIINDNKIYLRGIILKENLKVARQELKVKSRPYQAYGYYLGVPITLIIIMAAALLGFDNLRLNGVILILTVIANFNASKLALVSKRKYVAPVLVYVSNVISLLLLPELTNDIANGGNGDNYLALMGLILVPIEVIIFVFFLISANDIKKAYPTMKQDSKDARQNYVAAKKNK